MAATATEQVAVFDPSVVFTVIVADPADFAVMTPDEDTVATEVLLEDQVTFLFVAFEGETVAVKVWDSPTFIDNDVLFRLTPVTATVAAFTVTEQVACALPFLSFTVITEVPGERAFTLKVGVPSTVTDATVVLLDQTLISPEQFAGETAIDISDDCPTTNPKEDLLKVILFIPTTGEDTVTEHVAVFEPSVVFTVIVADPADFAVTTPDEDTVATEVLLEDQVTFLFVAFEGETVAVKVWVSPSVIDSDVLFRLTPVTETVAAFTVTVQVALALPFLSFTVITEVPGERAFTLKVGVPSTVTDATEVLLEPIPISPDQFVGEAVMDISDDCPTTNSREDLLKLILFIPTAGEDTVTEQVAVLEPSRVLTVMIAVPAPFAVTTPLELTVATDVLLEDQVTFLFVAFEGETEAVKVWVSPSVIDSDVLFRLTPVVWILEVTVTQHPAD